VLADAFAETTACRPFLLPEAPVTSLDEYLAMGGGDGLAQARLLGPVQTVKEVVLSGLRGRGGGGFRVGRKWAGERNAAGTHRYVVCNAAEGEPGTFKDRALIRANPYQVVEGVAIAALAVGAREAFIALKASSRRETARLLGAIREMQTTGLAGDVPITLAQGPEEYLFGEEKALLEVIEGNPPLPRLLPPYEHGLFATAPQLGWQAHDPEAGHHGRHLSNPTLVNNAETLANVPPILARGAEWHRQIGTTQSSGHVVCTVVGDVVRAGVEEIELGTPLSTVIQTVGGGPRRGRRVKAVFSGVANAVLTADLLDTPVSYEAMRAAGSGLGAAGFTVYDDSRCMVAVAEAISRFLYVESCGQCSACKLNSRVITDRLEAIEEGSGTAHDIDVIGARLRRVTDGNRCYLPVQEQQVVASILRAFPEDFAAHLEGRCDRRHDAVVVSKLVDITDGRAVYDERQALKQPDWTYVDLLRTKPQRLGVSAHERS
jgi:NADH:ubiquinone oxidoreductase subunit F (NADH-binding)